MLSDTNLSDNILNIGKRRERKVYYRPDGLPTGPLPADEQSVIHYMRKGFSLTPPGEKSERARCPFCDFKPENALGLRTHLTKHVNESKQEETK